MVLFVRIEAAHPEGSLQGDDRSLMRRLSRNPWDYWDGADHRFPPLKLVLKQSRPSAVTLSAWTLLIFRMFWGGH